MLWSLNTETTNGDRLYKKVAFIELPHCAFEIKKKKEGEEIIRSSMGNH